MSEPAISLGHDPARRERAVASLPGEDSEHPADRDHPAEAFLLQARERSPLALSWRTLLGLAAGLALGLILLKVAAGKVHLDQVWSTLSQTHPGWVALAALSVLLTTAAKIARWRALFPGTRRPSLWSLGQALLIGKSVNALLPARAGDAVRIYMAGEPPQLSRAVTLGTLAAEKAFDILSMVASGWLAMVLVPLPRGGPRLWFNLRLVGGVAAGFLVAALSLAWPQHRLDKKHPIVAWVGRWMQRLLRRLPRGLGARLTDVLERALSGLAALRRPRMALTAAAWSAAIWALAAGTNYLLFRAFDLRLAPGAAVFLLVLLYAGVAPPSSPGRLGVFHTLTVLGLELLGVPRVLGLAYATALHAIVYLPEILPGAALLGLRLAAARKRRSEILMRGPGRSHHGRG